MKYLVTLIGLFLTLSLYSQTLEDLINDGSGETKIDTESESYQNALKMGVELFEFSTSGCDESLGNQSVPVTILKKEFENDVLTVVFEFSDACCISFLGDIELKENSLNLKYDIYNEPCECLCYYTLTYKIRTSETFQSILLNGYAVAE
jgi:hypothetical protein